MHALDTSCDCHDEPAKTVLHGSSQLRRECSSAVYSASSLPLHHPDIVVISLSSNSPRRTARRISTIIVEDLARFDIAFDAGRIVRAATREQMFTASRDMSGKAFPSRTA